MPLSLSVQQDAVISFVTSRAACRFGRATVENALEVDKRDDMAHPALSPPRHTASARALHEAQRTACRVKVRLAVGSPTWRLVRAAGAWCAGLRLVRAPGAFCAG